MSNNWNADVHLMHTKFKMRERVLEKASPEYLSKLMEFRLNFLDEELLEARKALANDEADDIVDAMIDLCVVAIGTLDLFQVDAQKAWDRVHVANMSKESGMKASRPNKLGLPDLIKPTGWVGPEHKDNIGIIYNGSVSNDL